jgi:hypothetical protein
MNSRVELGPKSQGYDLGISALVSVRLKKLRRERHLIERAILALTELSRARESRVRRALRN